MKTALLLVFIFLAPFSLSAQEKDQAELKEYFLDAEFFFAQEEYTDALYDYLEIYNNGFKENANINYRIGICYLNIPGQKERSIDYLLQASQSTSAKYKVSSLKQIAAPVDAFLYLGNAYRVNNMLDKAIESYNKYKELATSPGEISYATQQITACNTAIRFMNNALDIRFINLGDSVNGPSSNYKAVISGDGRTLVYMNELPFYDAVYFSTYSTPDWSAPVNITPQIQSDGDQFVSSVSYDGTQLFLTREDAFNSDIYVSKFSNGKWSRSEPVAGQDINTKFWESHASISRDGKTLYFTSNRKGGFGEMDIYRTQLQAGGQWGQPVNMGNGINTALNEDTPFITDNDSLLFFSSQGHENMGGYDVFVSRLGKTGQWSQPDNIKYPLNTTDDDLFLYPWHNARVYYASMIRTGGFGKEDIYAIQPADDMPLPELLAELIRDATEEPVPLPAEIKPVSPVETIDEEAETEPRDVAETTEPAEQETLPETAPPVVTEPVPVLPKEIDLSAVYFGFDNFQLSEAGMTELKKIGQLLKDFPGSHVRFIGHADAKGPAEYNLKLSERRARTALQYVADLGIEANRLSIQGMGEKNFAAINSNPDGSDNPEGRRLNRRVEYEIIGVDNTLIIINIPSVPEHLKFMQ
ncbi:MAG TPA: OmpA family protein [Bacteroidales bacterium]|nr:OmpA family protein [Bacteroidales bacterium]